MKTFTTFFSKIARRITTEKEIRKALTAVIKNPEYEGEFQAHLLLKKPQLPKSEALAHIAFLKYVWMGRGNRVLKTNPFTPEQCKQINDAIGICVSGAVIHKLSDDKIANPFYQIVLKDGEYGFCFYKKGNTVVTAENPLLCIL